MLANFFLMVLATLCLVDTVSLMHSSKAMEGYPVGYLSDCPGLGKKAVITNKTLKHLSFTVHGPGAYGAIKKRTYNYFQMKDLIKDPNIDWNKKTLLYVGGYLDHPSFIIGTSLDFVYKKLGYNVLLLDTFYFTTMEYPVACLYSRTVGMHVAEMLTNLTRAGMDPKKLELLGLSLGGQTISYIAKNYLLLTGMKISRLTGLDPAGPCFRNLGPEDRLDQSDGDFVDVIATNIDGYGMAAPVGHVNYYVNGGEYQPGDFLWIPCTTFCSHIRSLTLWLAALENQKSFIAIKCDSVQDARNRNCYERVPMETNLMGLQADKSKPGIYFLASETNYPYFLGKKGLRKENEVFQSLMQNMIDKDPMTM